jgi:hypothetical protein
VLAALLATSCHPREVRAPVDRTVAGGPCRAAGDDAIRDFSAPGDPGGRFTLAIVNGLTSQFWVESFAVEIDGRPVLGSAPRLQHERDVERLAVHRASLPEGEHTASAVVMVRFPGEDAVGCYLYAYCFAYCFTLRTEHRFTVAAGREASLDLVVEERGGITTPVEERPTLRWAWSER